MRALMGLIKDRHGTYYARHKVPERLQEAVARILNNGKARQAWLKKSLGTKVVSQANVRAKPVQMEFDRIIGQAEAILKERPLRSSLSDIEIKRITDFFLARALAVDEERRIVGRGDDLMFRSFWGHDDLKEPLEPGRGLSRGKMEIIQKDTEFVLATTEDQLARGDTRRLRGEVEELLDVFHINLDPKCADYFKLARAVQAAFVKYLRAVLARQKGEPIETPPLIAPNQDSTPATGTLKDALAGWQKERSPSQGVLAEYERAIRLFGELHGDIPIAQIKRSHARAFREALQDVPRHRSTKLLHAPLPELAEWGRKHPEAQKITAPTVNKLLGGVQTIGLWAHDRGMVPDNISWSDPFARMRLREDASERDAFSIPELNLLFRSAVFTKNERPKPGRGDAAFWMPLLGLYTGARRGELAALTVADVIKVEGVSAFTFVSDRDSGKTLKTRSSARTVPVHPQLIKVGLLHYVDTIRHNADEKAWLFPQIAPNVPGGLKAWTKWFNRHLRTIGVTDKRKVFHSFRHIFKDAMRAAGVPEDLNDALTGHSNATVGRGYGAKDIVRRFGIDALANAVKAANYRGLNLAKVRSG
jgi:integrase